MDESTEDLFKISLRNVFAISSSAATLQWTGLFFRFASRKAPPYITKIFVFPYIYIYMIYIYIYTIPLRS